MLNNIFGIPNSKLFICLRLSFLNYAFFPVQTLLINNATQEKIIKLVKISLFFYFFKLATQTGIKELIMR